MAITRLHGKAEKSEIEETENDSINRFEYSGHFWNPFFVQVFALPGFLVCSRARPQIRLEKINTSGLDSISKACILIPLLDI
jgi:hypothetical protein